MPKKPPHVTAPVSGQVAVAPDPCPNGVLYTVTATGVTITNYPNIFVYNGTAVVSIGCTYDAATGTVTGQSYASWPGVSTVEVRDYDTQTGSAVIVAVGSFAVI